MPFQLSRGPAYDVRSAPDTNEWYRPSPKQGFGHSSRIRDNPASCKSFYPSCSTNNFKRVRPKQLLHATCSLAMNRHQREALTFFKRREQGLHPSDNAIGIWSHRSDIEGDNVYDNASLRFAVYMLTAAVPDLSIPSRIAHSLHCLPFGEAGFLPMTWASVKL